MSETYLSKTTLLLMIGGAVMDSRYKNTAILALLSLGIDTAVILLILLIFFVSHQEDLLFQMLQNTAKGEIKGIAIAAAGPFGMWIIVFLILRYMGERAEELKPIKLYLVPDSKKKTGEFPSKKNECKEADCYYSISVMGKQIVKEKKTDVQTTTLDKLTEAFEAPFIYIPAIEKDDKTGNAVKIAETNPDIEVKLIFKNDLWISDTYVPNEGRVVLR